MTRLALSTMYAQHPRFDDGAIFARFAADAGFDAIEISHSTQAPKLKAIVAAGVLPIASIHQPAPWETTASGVPNADLNLAALDESERTQAVAFACRSIDLAADMGAPAVVLHLGHVGSPASFLADGDLRRGFSNGTDPAVRAGLLARRASTAEPYLHAARRSLLELAGRATHSGVVLGVESRINLHEIPLPSELPQLLDGFDPELAGYWHDVGHVEVLHRLGYVPRDDWFRAPGVATVGAHLHDVIGVVDHRAPGRGGVDWRWHLDHLAHLDSVTLEIDQHEPDGLVLATPAFLRRQLSPRS